MLPCHGCLRHRMLQIRCGNMKESGCSDSPCHILHIIKGKAPEHRCMTDWARANLVSSDRLHRSDRSSPIGQTGLNRGQSNPILQIKNIASRRKKMKHSPCKLIHRRLRLMMSYRLATPMWSSRMWEKDRWFLANRSILLSGNLSWLMNMRPAVALQISTLNPGGVRRD